MEDLSTFNYDSYAALVPELKRAVLRVKSELFITLDAVRAIETAGGVDDTEMVGTLLVRGGKEVRHRCCEGD